VPNPSNSAEYRSLAKRYLAAIALTVLATVLQMWLSPILGGSRYLILIGAIVLSATYGGFGPAFLAIALASAVATYFFITPNHSLLIINPKDAIQLTIFDIFMIVLSWTLSMYRAEAAKLRSERGQDLQEMANRIEDERRRLADIVSSVPGVVWEAHGNPDRNSQQIDYISEHVTRMLGYTVEEWLGTPNFWLTIVHPDDRDAAARHAQEHFAAGDFRVNSFRWLTKDCRAVWVESHSMVVKDDDGKPIGMRGVTLDITSRKRAEDSLRFLARVSEVVTSTLDAQATLENAAAAALPILGDLCVIDVVEGAAIRRAVVKHIDPAMADDARLLQTYHPRPDFNYGSAAAIRTGRPEIVNDVPPSVLAQRGDDEYGKLIARLKSKSYMVAPLTARSGTIGAVTVGSRETRHYDQTDLDLAGLFARRVALALENAQLHTAAVEANRAKDAFLATVSHELRTPMTATLGWVRMLSLDAVDDETMSLALESIDRSTRAQARLIEDILDVSSISSGKFRLDIAPVDLRAVITNAIETLRPAATAKQISIDVHLDFTPLVEGDANRLQQIVWNLVSNGIKFVPRGGHIEVRLARAENAARIIVSDDGPGIDPAFLPHVFERFRQADASTARAHSGLGLGLAIVRHLVELHGGSATAESEGSGKGATFTVELPLAISA
jgi:PAS domain S-box-containing protein